uniref:Putative tnp2 transposase n=1 Tax=Ipomoea trifida TaxID=35884 RepID=Q6JJ63_IPOTF|nr:putative tnp2 transposase [Ipomoea trifida]
MYNRLSPGKRGYTDEFLAGVEEFVNYACTLPVYESTNTIRCPCSKCKNRVHLSADEVRVHLYKKGFEPYYWVWTCHGEPIPTVNEQFQETRNESNQYETMVFDVGGSSFIPFNVLNNQEEDPHTSAKDFYDLLSTARQPLSPSCVEETELSYALKMMNIKATFNIPQLAMDQIFEYNKHIMGSDNRVPSRYYDSEKLISKLGLAHEKIDCCINSCMLYYKSDINDRQCKFCGEPRFKPRSPNCTRGKEVPKKRMHYLPLIPRLQRLYASPSSAEHMRWHYENRRQPGVMCHPSDGEAWKHFDSQYPDFGADPRNVRLGLCADGFSPFGLNAKSYSCWPVMVVPYNLPPSMCMTPPYTFLTCIIPGEHNPKANIDVYLQPLIDELQLLWETGVLTYDVSLQQNFMMRAMLMWTINDFPAYGMLSGWQTAGKLACPYCNHYTKSFYLKNGRKTCWFDCHRQFLPMDHPFRRNRDSFIKQRVEKSRPPRIWTGEELLANVLMFPKITDGPIGRLEGFGCSHNWKKRSIFWDLPYWKDNLLRHNLDVMHIEKNVFDNIFYTVMDVKGTRKNKDTPATRLDIKEGTSLSHGDSLFFGTLKEIVEVEYPNIPLKKVVLFNCEWFDPTPNTDQEEPLIMLISILRLINKIAYMCQQMM